MTSFDTGKIVNFPQPEPKKIRVKNIRYDIYEAPYIFWENEIQVNSASNKEEAERLREIYEFMSGKEYVVIEQEYC